jgi:isoleucyl-tRNA synthetase
LIQTIQPAASGDFIQLGQDINGIQNNQMKQLLRGMYESSGNIEKFQSTLAAWFDSGTDTTGFPDLTFHSLLRDFTKQ